MIQTDSPEQAQRTIDTAEDVFLLLAAERQESNRLTSEAPIN